MITKEDVILAAVNAAHAVYEFDVTDHESDEEANEMYYHMVSQIAKIPILAVAEWRGRHPDTRLSEPQILEQLCQEYARSPAQRTH